jgi:hypothetical protein
MVNNNHLLVLCMLFYFISSYSFLSRLIFSSNKLMVVTHYFILLLQHFVSSVNFCSILQLVKNPTINVMRHHYFHCHDNSLLHVPSWSMLIDIRCHLLSVSFLCNLVFFICDYFSSFLRRIIEIPLYLTLISCVFLFFLVFLSFSLFSFLWYTMIEFYTMHLFQCIEERQSLYSFSCLPFTIPSTIRPSNFSN